MKVKEKRVWNSWRDQGLLSPEQPCGIVHWSRALVQTKREADLPPRDGRAVNPHPEIPASERRSCLRETRPHGRERLITSLSKLKKCHQLLIWMKGRGRTEDKPWPIETNLKNAINCLFSGFSQRKPTAFLFCFLYWTNSREDKILPSLSRWYPRKDESG